MTAGDPEMILRMRNPLPVHEVHVWRIDLGRPEKIPGQALVLSADERRRADRFVSPRDRERFIAARAAMRMILGDYLGRDPAGLTIEASPFGKPNLAGDTSLQFNLSHSGDLALLAVAGGLSLGIDLETIRPMREMAGIVQRYFAEAEQVAFSAASGEARPALFFRMWTRKEAYLKAIGVGLSGSLESIDLGVGEAPMTFTERRLLLDSRRSRNRRRSSSIACCRGAGLERADSRILTASRSRGSSRYS